MNKRVLLAVEESINSKKHLGMLSEGMESINRNFFSEMTIVSAGGVGHIPEAIEAINKHIRKPQPRRKGQTTALYEQIICYIKRLDNNDFLKQNGEVSEAAFYQNAYIDKSTWYEIKWMQNRPSKKTIWKLIIALKLSPGEAKQLLERGREQLDAEDIQDQILEAIVGIRNQFDLEVDDVQRILYEYQQMYKEIKPFDSIYETAEMIRMRKKYNAE